MNSSYGEAGQPIENTYAFLGRQTEVAWLLDQLAQDQPVLAIYGPRRMGKSAILKHLSRQLPRDYIGIYLDGAQVGGRDAASSLLWIAEEVKRVVSEQTHQQISPPDPTSFAQNLGQAWKSYADTVCSQLHSRKVVLLVDHADRQPAEWVHPLFDTRMTVILAASSDRPLAEQLTERLHGATSITLGHLDGEAAEELVREMLASKSQVDPWAVRRILEITSSHPYYIHTFCHMLLNCCSLRQQITPPDVEEALETLLNTPMPDLDGLWTSSSSREQAVLSVFSALRGVGGIATPYDIQKSFVRYGRPIPLSDIIDALERLTRPEVLERLGANSYRFTLELLRLWIHARHPPEQVLKRRILPPEVSPPPEGKRSRRRSLWASVAVVAIVILLVISQPVFWQERPRLAPTPGQKADQVTRTAAQVVTPAGGLTSTPASLLTAALPGYDLLFMSRPDLAAPWQIYAMNSATGDRLRLTETSSNERTPKWSPDGNRILFASDRDGNREIYVMNADGDNPVNLTQNKNPDWQPSWSPNGRQVAFSSYRDGNWEVYLIDTDGANLVRLTDHEASDFSPTWSPEGTQILFVSRRRGDADLYVMDLATRQLTQLTRSERDEYDPAWSPNGEWIAFVTQVEEQSDVFVMRADGSDPINLTHSTYANDFQPIWASDSEYLLFVSYTAAEGDHEIMRMRRDGSELSRVTDDDVDNISPSLRYRVP